MFEVLILAGVFLYLVVLHVSTALYWLEVWDRGKNRIKEGYRKGSARGY